MTTEAARELIHLADWIARRYGLSEMSKIRQACQAEHIHTEIVRRLGEANVSIQPEAGRFTPVPIVMNVFDMTHESDDPRGPWYPIKDDKITKRYVVKQVTP